MTHIKAAAIGAAFSLALLVSQSALAGPYSDEMAKCGVKPQAQQEIAQKAARLRIQAWLL